MEMRLVAIPATGGATLMDTTDEEAFLAKDQETAQPLRRRWRLLVTSLALISAAVLALHKQVQGEVDLGQLLGLVKRKLVLEPETCWVPGVFYGDPAKIPDTEPTQENSAEICQEKCKRQYGCLHFTYWPDGGCYLTSSLSKLQAAGLGFSNTVSGPRSCDDLSHYVEEFITGSVFCDQHSMFAGPTTGQQECQQRCDNHKKCGWYSYWHSGGQNWCRLTQHCQTVSAEFNNNVSVYKRIHGKLQEGGLKGTIARRKIGVNGRTCDAYPACRAVNLTEGNCCPNNNRIHLHCCNATVSTAKSAIKEAQKQKTKTLTLPA